MQSLPGKIIWQVFFIGCCGVVLWFFVQFCVKMVPYVKLSHRVDAHVESFSVKEVAYEKYAVEAHYRYLVQGNEYKKDYVFTTPVFLNRLAAENHISKNWSLKEWGVWYSDSDPSYSSLQKLFPFKFLFNTCLSIGILFYFVWLRNYVAKVS